MRRERRLALVVVTVGAATGLVGFVAGTRLESPDAAARRAAAPDPSVITAPVERRSLSSDIVTRGDVRYSESLDVIVDPDVGTGVDGGGALVVTGRVPVEGGALDEGTVAVEVSGRPVFVLAGALPMYRSIRPDASGPDVAQLEEALVRLGYDPGAVDGHYDEATEVAVAALYRAAGYEPVLPNEADRARLDGAEQQVAAARSGARQAEELAAQPEAPPSAAAAVTDAYDAYRRAQRALDDARRTIGVRVPRGEVVFVADLPRTVQRALARVAQPPDGPVVTLSGGVPRASTEVSAVSRQRVRPGSEVRLDDATLGVAARGRVASIAETPGTDGAAAGQYRVWIDTDDPAAARLVGLNVRVTIPVESTGGPVLAVPAAAVFTRADGGTYVQVVSPGGDELRSLDVPVGIGLSAGGMVEVRPEADGGLADGDEVVVGVR